MTKRYFKRFFIFLSAAVLIGFGVTAFAEWGMGYGHHGWGYHHEPGWHHGGWGESGYGNRMENLSESEYKKLEKVRTAFLNETETLRQNLYAKELELGSELSKQNPDPKKAVELQGDISKLEAQIDQKRITYIHEMRKLSPNIGKEYSNRGGYGRGYCW